MSNKTIGIYMKNFNIDVENHLKLDTVTESIGRLKRNLESEGLVQLDDILPLNIKKNLHSQARKLIETESKRRNLKLDATGGTRRAYVSVGRDTIKKDNGTITAFFNSPAIRDYLTKVAGKRLLPVPYKPEEYIINSQQKIGDTHGWHFDDYSFALIWIVEAPEAFDGGRLEYINGVKWDKNSPRKQLIELLTSKVVKSKFVPTGSCYLMRTREVLHRVAPLTNNTKRTVIIFTYASDEDISDKSISHETMEEIYAPEIVKQNITA